MAHGLLRGARRPHGGRRSGGQHRRYRRIGDGESALGRVDVAGDPVKRGSWFRITAQVSNAGPTPLDNVAVTLVHPVGLQLDRNETQTLARVPARGSKPAKWEACSNAPASYVILGRAEVGALVSESSANVVQVVPSSRTC